MLPKDLRRCVGRQLRAVRNTCTFKPTTDEMKRSSDMKIANALSGFGFAEPHSPDWIGHLFLEEGSIVVLISRKRVSKTGDIVVHMTVNSGHGWVRPWDTPRLTIARAVTTTGEIVLVNAEDFEPVNPFKP